MESMRENKALLYSLVSTGSFILLLALGWSPELCEQFSIVDFPDEVSLYQLIKIASLKKQVKRKGTMARHLQVPLKSRLMRVRIQSMTISVLSGT